MPCYAIDGVRPVVHPSSHVHPTAVLIGDVHVGPDCYIGPGASLRADFGRIELAQGANVQDNCVLHGFPERTTHVGVNGHIGHGAVLHGCVIENDVLVGMNAVVMDEAVVGARSIVAACAFVPAGMQIPPGHLAAGLPAKVRRELTETEMAWKHEGTLTYQDLTRRCLATLVEIQPLTEAEANRPRLKAREVEPLVALRRRE